MTPTPQSTAPQYGEVLDTTWLTPRMVRVRLGGEGLATFEPTAFTDQYVNVQFPPEGAPYEVPFDVEAAREGEHHPIGRRYTIRSWDPTTRQVTLDFVVHGDEGVAGPWAISAAPGDLLQFVGPSGGYAPDPDADWYLMAGDESALPAIAASLEAVPAGKTAMVVVVVDDPEHEIPLESPGEVRIDWVHRQVTSPRDFNAALEIAVAEAFGALPGTPDVFIHGEAGETRAAKKFLVTARGMDKSDMSASPYWRRGHDDEAWRAVKRDWLAEAEAEL